MNLQNKSAFVTGSTQGVGKAIALALANSGANVILHGLADDDSAKSARTEVEDAMGHPACMVFGDLSTQDGVEKVFREANSINSQIEILVNNAGTYNEGPFLEMSYDTFDKTMKLNVYAYFFLTQFFAQRWVKQKVDGNVLLIGSINGRLAEPTHAAYDTSKGAVEMMVKTLCVSLAPHNIRVNGLAPGLFETPLTASAIADPSFRRWMESHTPNGQIPTADACGETAAFLVSDLAKHLTGQMILVDGGMSAWQQPDPPSMES